jgi:hypothetical protein
MGSMTTLMVLMAGLTLGNDGTERISAETEQRLAIGGYWGGIAQSADTGVLETHQVRLEPDLLIWVGKLGEHATNGNWIDEGQGKCRFGRRSCYGIFKRESGQLVICYGERGERPARFQADAHNYLLILKPVKPPKK